MKTLAKITFLIVTTIFFTNTRSLAQCTPATSLPGYGIFPDSLAIATKNVAYQQVMQFESPTDTTVTVPVFGTVPAKIDSISIDSVVGMPTRWKRRSIGRKCSPFILWVPLQPPPKPPITPRSTPRRIATWSPLWMLTTRPLG